METLFYIIGIIFVFYVMYWVAVISSKVGLLLIKSIFGIQIESDEITEEETKEDIPSEEIQATMQKDFSLLEAYLLDVSGKINWPEIDFTNWKKYLSYMLENEKLKSKNGKIVTKEAFIKLNKHRNITNKCIELELNPKNRDDRESAEYLLDADNYDEEYDDEVYDDDDYEDVDSGYRKNKKGEDDEESDSGEYVIQYRTGYGGWIDGPGSNDERIAERLFDNFVSKEMMHRNAVRARLVKINSSGRVISVLGTS